MAKHGFFLHKSVKGSKKCYGFKRIYEDLLAARRSVSERCVARTMKENGLSPRQKKRRMRITTEIITK
jgi:putative transposase